MSSILLVDDHPMVREGLRAVLQMAGHTVVGEAGSVEQALELLLALSPDLVVLDLSLGPRSGLELLATVAERQLAVHVIVLSMSAQPHHVAEAVRRGASGYLLKGSPSSELLRAIHAVSIGHRHFSEEIARVAQQTLRGDGPGDPLARLTRRERQILEMVVRGSSSASIGLSLHLSSTTVDTYRSRLMRKLETPDLASLVRFAIRHGLIGAD